MDEKVTTTAVIVRCMDKRHTEKSRQALEAVIGKPIELYELTEPGGAGILNGLFGDDQKEWLIKKIGICLENLGCTEVYISTHGTSETDCHGCGGYSLQGHKEKFDDHELSHDFMVDELQQAGSLLKSLFPEVKVRAFYVTFGENAHHLVKEISLG